MTNEILKARLESLKTRLAQYQPDSILHLSAAVLCGATIGLFISISLPRITTIFSGHADSDTKTAITESERKVIELAAVERYREELMTSSESYIDLLKMLRVNVQNNPGRYQVIVEDTQKKIEELEEEIGIISKLSRED